MLDESPILPIISCLVHGRLAQLVEQLTLNQRVVGSNPASPIHLNRSPLVTCETFMRNAFEQKKTN